MTYEEIITKVRDTFKDADVSKIKEHLAYQFNITGVGKLKVEGDLGKALKLKEFM